MRAWVIVTIATITTTTATKDQWDDAVKPHKRRELGYHVVLLGGFCLLAMAHFRQQPQFPADEFMEDLRSIYAMEASASGEESADELCLPTDYSDVHLVRVREVALNSYLVSE